MIADADLPPEAGPASAPLPASPARRAVFLIGSAGLLVAAGTDALAVLGRHLGFRLLGSIEVVQVAVVLIASAAIVAATLVGAHAAVHIVTARLSPVAARRLGRAIDLVATLTFLSLAAGSAWVAADLWHGYERTEILALPLRPFRLVWIAATLIVAVLFARRAAAGGGR